MFSRLLLSIKWFTYLCIFVPFISHSSVVMTGTRIIYNESSKEKSLQFTNNSDTHYVVDISITDKPKAQSNKSVGNQFIAIPPIFKISPQEGQVIKLVKMADNLPKEVESVLYFNFTQIPGVSREQESQNQLTLLFNSQVKIFYRPKSIENQLNTLEKLTVSKNKDQFRIDNQSPFHIVIKEARLISEKNKVTLVRSVMLSPKSVYTWDNPLKNGIGHGAKIEFEIINDYGSSQIYTKKIN
ncbi:fimbrial biogenesis chaperone [Providencia sp. PROV197]|uniref:fimbrial biogenesis chaperone n=1 Tax=Providencia sp. PROV197 TaxID=2949898 RepID=UPI0023492A72|nr:molecular chaperone [Providencia sp. PROV197]